MKLGQVLETIWTYGSGVAVTIFYTGFPVLRTQLVPNWSTRRWCGYPACADNRDGCLTRKSMDIYVTCLMQKDLIDFRVYAILSGCSVREGV